jgi:RNA polymerase sigma factor (sigma-70 family)
MLSNEELAAQARAGDAAARSCLIERNINLVHSIVGRFIARGEEPEDLFQVGCIGLIKAAERFDASFGTRFSTYAVPLVIGEIKRYLRDTGPIKVSRRLKEVAGQAQRMEARLSIELAAHQRLTRWRRPSSCRRLRSSRRWTAPTRRCRFRNPCSRMTASRSR